MTENHDDGRLTSDIGKKRMKWLQKRSKVSKPTLERRQQQAGIVNKHKTENQINTNTTEPVMSLPMEMSCIEQISPEITGGGNGIAPSQKASKKLKWKEGKMRERGNTPCRFYASDGGCWRGEACMFLHGTVEPSRLQKKSDVAGTFSCLRGAERATNGDGGKELGADHSSSSKSSVSHSKIAIDVEMNDLASQVGAKAQISVPEKIMFGRRRQR